MGNDRNPDSASGGQKRDLDGLLHLFQNLFRSIMFPVVVVIMILMIHYVHLKWRMRVQKSLSSRALGDIRDTIESEGMSNDKRDVC